jgi:hypothetical protein
MKFASRSSLLGIATLMVATACSSGSGGSDNSDGGGGGITTLSSIPSISEMLNDGSASANLTQLRFAVSGGENAPLLLDLSEDNIDEYFWNGLLAELADEESLSDQQRQDFWQGEGSCRMAQNVGYSFENIERSGTSLCYMKNLPEAESGVTVTAGDIDDPSEAMTQAAQTKVVKINITNASFGDEESPDQTVMIRIYGTDSETGANGYASDLWFCAEGQDSPSGVEQIRINNAAQTMISSNVQDDDNGQSYSEFSGNLAEDEDGTPVFDPAELQAVTFIYNGEHDGNESNFKGYVAVQNGEMTTKSWFIGEWEDVSQAHKNYAVNSFAGTSLDTLRFLSAGFANSWSSGDFEDTFDGAISFQDTHYVADEESNEYFELVDDYDFDSDSFFEGESFSVDQAKLDLVSSETYACDVEVDIEIDMDFSDPGPQAVQELCEVRLSDTQYCDGNTVREIRELTFGGP